MVCTGMAGIVRRRPVSGIRGVLPAVLCTAALVPSVEHIEKILRHPGVACYFRKIHGACEVHHFLHTITADTQISGHMDHFSRSGIRTSAHDAILCYM